MTSIGHKYWWDFLHQEREEYLVVDNTLHGGGMTQINLTIASTGNSAILVIYL